MPSRLGEGPRHLLPAEPERGACLAAGCPEAVHEALVARLEDYLYERMPGEPQPVHEAVARALATEAEAVQVDPLLVLAMIHVESGFDPGATSSAGARGLMQLLPGTMLRETEELGLCGVDGTDPVANVRAGVRYLRRCLDAYAGHQERALMAYNTGPNRVLEFLRKGEVPDWAMAYPRRVEAELRQVRKAFGVETGPRVAELDPPVAGEPMRVSEVFLSIQGEGTRAGLPCAFVRFTGCDLRCTWCDTAHAFQGGVERSRSGLVDELAAFSTRLVCLTGGEPLLQPELPELCQELLDRGWEVTVETHGQRPTDALPPAVVRILDVKPPGSGEETRDFAYLEQLRPQDEVKFVVASEADFHWSVEVARRHRLEGRAALLFSPVFGKVSPQALTGWLLASGLRARLSLQLHKLVWGPDARGV